jgi:hypothetical protein
MKATAVAIRLIGLIALVLSGLTADRASDALAQNVGVIVTAPAPIGPPATDGRFVVWVAAEGGDERAVGVYAARLDDGRIVPVATGPGVRTLGAIDGGVVVWSAAAPDQLAGSRRIEAYDLATGRASVVADGPGDETRPVVGGAWVVWMHLETPSGAAIRQLRGRNLRTMSPPVVLAPLEGTLVSAAIDGDRLTWVERLDGEVTDFWRVGRLALGGGDPPIISIGPALRATGDTYAIAGDLLVFGSAYAGQLVSVSVTAQQRQLVTSRFGGGAVATDGRFVVWVTDRGAPGGAPDIGLVGYDTLTRSGFAIPGSAGGDAPSLHNAFLAWRRSGADMAKIHSAPLRVSLPSAPQPASLPADPEQRFFPETGHRLSYGFKAFWEQQGALPIFGYPLTEEFGQAPAGLGPDQAPFDLRRTVQYFERQRFEHHPELAGTAYEVTLGQLGAEDAQRRGMLTTPPFRPVAPDRTSADCLYFTETGHRACGYFRAYWQGHGLELGDAGTSFRESLALFGYPISEAYADPDTGRTVQYFERARFEADAEAQATGRVLLGRLGAGALATFGW